MNEHRVRQVFVISVLLKGAHALIECIGGILLAVVSTNAIASVVDLLTQDEIVRNPHDFIANHLRVFAHNFSVGSKEFYAFYLLSHGIVKIFLVVGLLNNKLWAYPASLVALALFIIYQIYRFLYTYSLGLIGLTVLDFIVMWLIWHEYRLIREHRPIR